MSENRAVCVKCGQQFSLNPGNAVVHFYEKQPWFTWQQLICTHCGHQRGAFIIDNYDWEMRWCVDNDIGFITEDFAPPEVVAMYTDVYHIVVVESHDLTPYEEKEVAFFHWIIEHDHYEGWWDDFE